MAKNPGNWFSNAKEVLAQLQYATINGVFGGQVGQYTASGAISVNDKVAQLATSATAMTLADGVMDGQVIDIKSFGITADVTPASFTDGTKITLDDGEFVTLAWDGNDWFALGNTGVIS